MKRRVEMQLEVLLARDAAGRLTTTRDPAPRPAPRFFLARSNEGNAFAVRADVDAAVRSELERLAREEPPLAAPAATSPPACAPAVRALLAPVESEWRGPAFELPDLRHAGADARARLVEHADLPACSAAFPWLAHELDAVWPVAVAFEAGEAAALCHAPRGITDDAAEAGVETLARFRRRGLAAAAVACWARAVQATGRIALYSTSWENTASRGLARRLRARLYAEDWHLT